VPAQTRGERGTETAARRPPQGATAAFRRARERIRARPALNLAYRIAVGAVGAAIIAGGVVLLPLPGPGWVIIFVGLGVLASEFEWARRLLHFAREKVAAWTRWVARQSWIVRALLGLGVLLVVAGCLAGYVVWRGVPGWVPFVG
jgi:uncharacterized protein (TIGR02611 family)